MNEQVSMHADAAVAAETVLAAALQKTFASDQARALTGLVAIHQLANGYGLPSWLLWCADRPGAYQLDVADASDASLLGSETVLVLRYFPSPDEPAISEFTEEERELRLSPAFDLTGTPIFGALNLIGTDLFALGRLGLRLDGAGQLYQLTWDAPADGDAVSAWELGLTLVDALVSSLCLAQGKGPSAAGAMLGLEAEGVPPAGWARLWVGLQGPSSLPGKKPGQRIMAEANSEHGAIAPLNPEWWRIGHRHFHDADNQCLCCCHDH